MIQLVQAAVVSEPYGRLAREHRVHDARVRVLCDRGRVDVIGECLSTKRRTLFDTEYHN